MDRNIHLSMSFFVAYTTWIGRAFRKIGEPENELSKDQTRDLPKLNESISLDWVCAVWSLCISYLRSQTDQAPAILKHRPLLSPSRSRDATLVPLKDLLPSTPARRSPTQQEETPLNKKEVVRRLPCSVDHRRESPCLSPARRTSARPATRPSISSTS
jgi:hypothetical protein